MKRVAKTRENKLFTNAVIWANAQMCVRVCVRCSIFLVQPNVNMFLNLAAYYRDGTMMPRKLFAVNVIFRQRRAQGQSQAGIIN